MSKGTYNYTGHPVELLLTRALQEKAQIEDDMLGLMRELKKVNPGDAYYENYLGMMQKYGPSFFDTYHMIRTIGRYLAPKRILEIGTRTGISLCQLLEAHSQRETIEKVVCVDPFDQWTGPNIVRANLKHIGLPHDPDVVQILAMKSEDYFARRDYEGGRFDYILVDGDHERGAARVDLDAAHRLLERGGIIVFDDVSPNPGECGLIEVWNAWKEIYGHEYDAHEVLEGKGVAWAIKK